MADPFWPREHGAYAQLGFPLLSGLLLERPSLPAVAFALAAILLFLAHEPAAVRLGMRGARLREALGRAAGRRLWRLVTAGVLAGGVALVAAPSAARLLALVPLLIGLALVPLVATRRAKTLPGEALVAAAFAGMHLPVGYASGLRGVWLWGPAALWFAVFVLATLAVHAIKARQEGRSPGLRAASDASAVLGLLSSLLVLTAGDEYRWLGLAGLFPASAIVAVGVARVPARRLKRVGWAVVGSNLAALLVLALAR